MQVWIVFLFSSSLVSYPTRIWRPDQTKTKNNSYYNPKNNIDDNFIGNDHHPSQANYNSASPEASLILQPNANPSMILIVTVSIIATTIIITTATITLVLILKTTIITIRMATQLVPPLPLPPNRNTDNAPPRRNKVNNAKHLPSFKAKTRLPSLISYLNGIVFYI